MRRDFPVSNAGISVAFEYITTAVGELGFNESLAHRLSVIVDEICANMIRHDDSLTGGSRFSLEFSSRPEAIVMTIIDPGQPFNPLEHRHESIPEIGGHGISLIKGLSSDVRYRRSENQNHLTVVVDAEE